MRSESISRISRLPQGPTGERIGNGLKAGVRNVKEDSPDDREEYRSPKPGEVLARLDSALAKLNEMTRIFNRSIKFSVHEESHRLWVRVIDTEENKVIREIPPEEILEIVARIQEFLGLLIDEKC